MKCVNQTIVPTCSSYKSDSNHRHINKIETMSTPLTRPSLEDCTKKLSLMSVIANEQCRLVPQLIHQEIQFFINGDGSYSSKKKDREACRDVSRAVLKLSKDCLKFEPKN